MPVEIVTPVGRLVGGHPMVAHAQTDSNTQQPKIGKDGQPVMQYYCAIAILKGQEQHWNQTEWGQKIYNEGVTSWSNGEYNAPDFAWKITDGDSQIPNKKGVKPCTREGYPGHWVINASNGFPVKCYHRGMYEPHQVIQRKEEMKPGDYIRLVIDCRGNAPSQSPGVYINPSMCELYQAGVEIVLVNQADPNATFGTTAGVLPQGASVDNNVAPPPVATQGNVAPPPVATQGNVAPPPVPPVAPVAPEMDYATPAPPVEETYVYNNTTHTKSSLLATGWTEAQIASLPKG